MHPRRVAPDLNSDQLPPQGDVGSVERIGQPVRGGLRDGGEITRDERELQGSSLRGCEPLQVIDHAGQAQHLVTQRRQVLGRGLGHAVEHGFMTRLQDGDRRAQLVRDIGDQVAPHSVLFVTRVGHMVECLGQFPDLAESGHVAGAGAQLAPAPGPDRADQPVHGGGDPLRDQQCGDQGDHGRRAGRGDASAPPVGLELLNRRAQAHVAEPDGYRAYLPPSDINRLAELGSVTTRGEAG